MVKHVKYKCVLCKIIRRNLSPLAFSHIIILKCHFQSVGPVKRLHRGVVNVTKELLSAFQVTLNNYSFENVAFHVLHQRFPLYSARTLSDWFDHNTDLYRFVHRSHVVLSLLYDYVS